MVRIDACNRCAKLVSALADSLLNHSYETLSYNVSVVGRLSEAESVKLTETVMFAFDSQFYDCETSERLGEQLENAVRQCILEKIAAM